MDRIFRRSQGVEGVRFGESLFPQDREIQDSSVHDLQLSLDRFAAECEAVGVRISTSKCGTMVLSQKKVECLL